MKAADGIEAKEPLSSGKKKSRKRYLFILILLVVAGLFLLLVRWGAGEIRNSLYAEQTANLSDVMEKVSRTVDAVIMNRWDDAEYCANELCQQEYETTEDIVNRIADMESILEVTNVAYFLVDSQGKCTNTKGESFPWVGSSTKDIGVDSVFVANVDYLGDDSKMVFPSKLPHDITVEGTTYTHLALVCNIRSLDEYFKSLDYGESSSIMIIDVNGDIVYHQSNDGIFGKESNFFELSKRPDRIYSSTGKSVIDNIAEGTSDCSISRYKGENYFTAYQKLDKNNWFAVITVPASVFGQSSIVFLYNTSYYIILIAFILCFLITVAFLLSDLDIRRKQKTVNENLRRSAESQQKAVEAERDANLAKTRFLSSMSHDIRTPMNAITGITSIALQKPDDAPHMKECLEKISDVSSQMLTLINDILDISKIESGKAYLVPGEFSLAQMFRRLVDIISLQAAEKKLSLDIHIRNIGHEYLYADELRLNQIYMNLLTNAVKYSFDAGGVITIDLRQEDIFGKPEQTRLVFSVRDTGIGMSEEYMKNMYDPFSRVADSRISKVQGSGLGLAIVKSMVELMKGSIECESKVGEGTCFTVTVDLPFVKKEVSDSLRLSDIKLLIADNDDEFSDCAAETIRSMGASADTAKTFKDTERLIADSSYDAVIISGNLQDYDGLAAVRMIRSEMGNMGDNIPILYASSMSSDETTAENARNAGADGCISRLLFRSVIHDELNRHLHFDDMCGESGSGLHAEELRGIRILIAEDNDLNWEIILSLLDAYGISADRAENGEICVDMLSRAKKGKYSLVLMDIQMPVMNGKEAARAIRSGACRNYTDIPIIALTADAFSEDIADCISSGMNGHVAKPIDMKSLLCEMRRVLEL